MANCAAASGWTQEFRVRRTRKGGSVETKESSRYSRPFGAIFLCIAATFACPAAWAGPVVEFDIPAGEARETLKEFSRQSQVALLYSSSVVKGVQTQAISGKMDATQALFWMLKGTGLTF